MMQAMCQSLVYFPIKLTQSVPVVRRGGDDVWEKENDLKCLRIVIHAGRRSSKSLKTIQLDLK